MAAFQSHLETCDGQVRCVRVEAGLLVGGVRAGAVRQSGCILGQILNFTCFFWHIFYPIAGSAVIVGM